MPEALPLPRAIPRRSFLLAAAAVLAGCNGTMPFAEKGPAASAPVYRPGDRWVYRARDGFRLPVVWQETREILTTGADGITVRISQQGPTIDSVRTEQWAAPGLVHVGSLFDDETRKFASVLKRYDFPLFPGKTWNQWVNDFNEQTHKSGQINRYVTVGGWRRIVTPAGAFESLALRVIMHLDDEEFWRDPTECNYLVWYAPAVRATVREEKDAQYFEKSDRFDGVPVRSQHALLELESFRPGA